VTDFTVEELAAYIEEEFYNDLWYDLWAPYKEIPTQSTPYGTIEYVTHSDDGYDDGRIDRSVVFRIGDRYFRKSGYYDSWEGGDWDGELEEVRPREKMITVYEAI